MSSQRNTRYIYAGHDDWIDVYPGNIGTDFCYRLLDPIQIADGDRWSIAISDISFSAPLKQPVYICCDTCAVSQTGRKMLPILRQLIDSPTRHFTFDRLEYRPLTKGYIDSIRIYLTDELERNTSLYSLTLKCALHIRRDTPWNV